ncbi:MAG: helix-turn-helix domain-containing protein [Bizionia sp.]|nr:helix-turn-helix domain-containing protein [Bizionia sp.]
MGATIITTEDLYDFKLELIAELKKILTQKEANFHLKKFLKSAEVMELLQVSPGTLQNLRINGTIPYIKMGGTMLYEYQEILSILESNKVS